MARDRISRRTCLIGATVPFVMAMTAPALAETLETAARSRKPVLRERSLNRVFGRPTDPDYVATLQAIRSDLGVFLQDRFTLTALQRREIASIPEQDIRALNSFLEGAIQAKDPIRAEIVQLTDNPGRDEIMRRFGLEPSSFFKKLVGIRSPSDAAVLKIPR